MEGVDPYAEKYLMKLTFYADNDHTFHSGFVKETHSFPTCAVSVRLTNASEKPLTNQNLQRVVLSIPDLHYRLTGHAYAAGLLHLAHLETTLDVSHLAGPTSALLKPEGQTWDSPTCSSIPLTKTSPCEDHGSEGDGRSRTTADWLRCDGSFVPNFLGTEWTSVMYGGMEFIRAFSPIRQTDEAADILGRCNITDYTVYEQFVCSVDMDILNIEDPSGREEFSPTSKNRENCLGGRDPTSAYKREESSRKETNRLGRKATSLNNKWEKRISLVREDNSSICKREKICKSNRGNTCSTYKWKERNSSARSSASTSEKIESYVRENCSHTYKRKEKMHLDQEDASSSHKRDGIRVIRKAVNCHFKRKGKVQPGC